MDFHIEPVGLVMLLLVLVGSLWTRHNIFLEIKINIYNMQVLQSILYLSVCMDVYAYMCKFILWMYVWVNMYMGMIGEKKEPASLPVKATPYDIKLKFLIDKSPKNYCI